MSLSSVEELAIRKALADKFALAADAGYIIPAPVFFVDSADFFATVNALTTQKLIETTQIAFCSLSLRKFEDSLSEGCSDEPLIRLTYNAYFFREYDFEREDESLTPDEFLKKTLKSYNRFLKAIFAARTEFLGIQNLTAAVSFDVKTNSLIQEEFFGESEICRYIPKVRGHSADLQTIVEVLINE